MKTESEQIEELKNALDALTEVVLLVTQGKNYMIGHVATALRSLVYWKGQNYSPLLIRLAGRFSLPLPIFAVLDSEEIPAIVSEANLHFSSQNASIVKEFPAHILVDLQDWLSVIVFTVQTSAGEPDEITMKKDTKTVNDIILDTSTVMGTAHYDEDMPDTLEIFSKMGGPTGTEIKELIMNVAAIVIDLGYYVLRHCKPKFATKQL